MGRGGRRGEAEDRRECWLVRLTSFQRKNGKDRAASYHTQTRTQKHTQSSHPTTPHPIPNQIKDVRRHRRQQLRPVRRPELVAVRQDPRRGDLRKRAGALWRDRRHHHGRRGKLCQGRSLILVWGFVFGNVCSAFFLPAAVSSLSPQPISMARRRRRGHFKFFLLSPFVKPLNPRRSGRIGSCERRRPPRARLPGSEWLRLAHRDHRRRFNLPGDSRFYLLHAKPRPCTFEYVGFFFFVHSAAPTLKQRQIGRISRNRELTCALLFETSNHRIGPPTPHGPVCPRPS